jgi:hypothetical protein
LDRDLRTRDFSSNRVELRTIAHVGEEPDGCGERSGYSAPHGEGIGDRRDRHAESFARRHTVAQVLIFFRAPFSGQKDA